MPSAHVAMEELVHTLMEPVIVLMDTLETSVKNGATKEHTAKIALSTANVQTEQLATP